MRRTIRSYRTRQNIRHTSALRDQFLRELTKEAQGLFDQLSEKFSQDLQLQMTQLLEGAASSGTSAATSATARDGDSGDGLAKLLSTGVRYLISRPRTSRNTQETTRSLDVGAQFRVSQAQAMAEAQQAIGKGEKNL